MRVLLCLILAVTVGCYRGTTPAAPPAPLAPRASRTVASADVLAYLPATSSLVIVGDLEKVMRSPALQALVPLLEKQIPAHFAQAFAACGFDPLSLRRASIGLFALDGPKPRGVMVLRGYRRDVLMKCIDQASAKEPARFTFDRGVVVMPTDGNQVALTFADDATLVIQVGPDASVASLLEVLDGGAPLRTTARFTDQLAKLQAQDPLWFVVDDAPLTAKLIPATPIRSLAGSLQLTSSLTAQVRIGFADATAAGTTATLLQSQVASATMFFDQLDVTAEDTDVVIRAAMSDAKLTALISMITGAIGP